MIAAIALTAALSVPTATFQTLPVCHPNSGVKQAVCVATVAGKKVLRTDHGKHTYALPETITINI